MKRIKKSLLTIGADPEFTIVDPLTGAYLSALDLMEGLEDRTTAKFGTDGHSETAELRPSPSTNPDEVTQDIKDTLASGQTKFPNLWPKAWLATSYNDPVGGHIHFGHPVLKDNKKAYSAKIKLSNNLDNLLGIPFMFLESLGSSDKRKRGSYGNLNGFRDQPWGIEYRTLASWLASEQLTRAVLRLAYAIAYDTLENGLETENIHNVRGLNDLFRQNARKLLKPLAHEAYKTVKTLTLYPQYKDDLDWLFDSVYRERELLTVEIKAGWNIGKTDLVYLRLADPVKFYTPIAKILKNKVAPNYISTNEDNDHDFINGSGDIGITKIQALSNWALTEADPAKRILINRRLRLYGIARARGNLIEITLDKYPSTKRLIVLTDTIKGLCAKLEPTVKVTIVVKINPYTTEGFVRLGLPVKLRLSKTLLPELLAIYTLISQNPVTKRGQADQIIKVLSQAKTLKVKKIKPPVDFIITSHVVCDYHRATALGVTLAGATTTQYLRRLDDEDFIDLIEATVVWARASYPSIQLATDLGNRLRATAEDLHECQREASDNNDGRCCQCWARSVLRNATPTIRMQETEGQPNWQHDEVAEAEVF